MGLQQTLKALARPDSPGDIESAEKRAYARQERLLRIFLYPRRRFPGTCRC